MKNVRNKIPNQDNFIQCNECKKGIGVNEQYLCVTRQLERFCEDETIQVDNAVFEYALCNSCKDMYQGIKIILKTNSN